MFVPRTLLNVSLSLIVMTILFASLSTSEGSIMIPNRYVQAQTEPNSNATERQSDNNTAVYSENTFNTFNKMIKSVCNTTGIDKVGPVDANRSQTYLNPYYGIIIKYPSNWNYSENEASAQDSKEYSVVSFSPPLSFDPNAESNVQLWVERLDDPTISLDEYAKNVVKSYRSSTSNFKLITGSSTNSTISNLPAYEIVFTDFSNNLQRKSVEIGTLSNVSKSAYYITFNTDASLYNKVYPLVHKMIDSFELYDYRSPPLPEEEGKPYLEGYNDGLELMIRGFCLSPAGGNVSADNL